MTKLRDVTPHVRVGTPLVRHNLSIFPLFAEDHFEPALYLPVGAAIRAGSARITEASVGGSVPTLALENLTDIPVLIIDGEELLGAKQNRISNLTVLAPGKHTLPLPVSCVERGRWNYRSHEFAESPDIMYNALRAKKSRAVSRNMAMSGSRLSDQGAVWEDIDNLSQKLGYNSPTSSMQDVFQSRRASVEEYLRDVDVADGQIGAIFAINGSAAGVELFDSTDTLRTYMPKVLRSYALDAIANTSTEVVETSEVEAALLLDSILELDAKSFPAVGLGEDLRIDSQAITGGALTQNGRMIHLAAFHTAPPPVRPRGETDDDSTRPLVIRRGHMLLRGGNGRVALLDTGSPVSIAGYRHRLSWE